MSVSTSMIPDGFNSWKDYVISVLKENGGKMKLNDIYLKYRNTTKYKDKAQKRGETSFRGNIRRLFKELNDLKDMYNEENQFFDLFKYEENGVTICALKDGAKVQEHAHNFDIVRNETKKTYSIIIPNEIPVRSEKISSNILVLYNEEEIVIGLKILNYPESIQLSEVSEKQIPEAKDHFFPTYHLEKDALDIIFVQNTLPVLSEKLDNLFIYFDEEKNCIGIKISNFSKIPK